MFGALLGSVVTRHITRTLKSPPQHSGVSVAAGIPDFRSQGGMYETLRPETITATQRQRQAMASDPTYVVERGMFLANQFPYLARACSRHRTPKRKAQLLFMRQYTYMQYTYIADQLYRNTSKKSYTTCGWRTPFILGTAAYCPPIQ